MDSIVHRFMGAVKLYKYLDYNGGRMMLHHSNLQFTNATQLNDPFDCHPALIDFSKVPENACGGWTPEIIEQLRSRSEEPEKRRGFAVFRRYTTLY